MGLVPKTGNAEVDTNVVLEDVLLQAIKSTLGEPIIATIGAITNPRDDSNPISLLGTPDPDTDVSGA